MKPSFWIAAFVGGVAFWIIWVGSAAASRRVGMVETYRETRGSNASAGASWKAKGNLLFAAMLGAGIVVMQELTGIALLQALGLWLVVLAYPAVYKYGEGIGEHGRAVGLIRAGGFLAASLAAVVVVYAVLDAPSR